MDVTLSEIIGDKSKYDTEVTKYVTCSTELTGHATFNEMMSSQESTESLEVSHDKYESNSTLLAINNDSDTDTQCESVIGKQAMTSKDYSNEIIETKESDVRDTSEFSNNDSHSEEFYTTHDNVNNSEHGMEKENTSKIGSSSI